MRIALRRILLLPLLLAPLLQLRAEYTPATLLAESQVAHAELQEYSLQVWSRSFRWNNDEMSALKTSVAKVVKEGPGVIGLATVIRNGTPNSSNGTITYRAPYRVALHVEPGPRYLTNQWNDQRKRWIERSVSRQAYVQEFNRALYQTLQQRHPFSDVLFDRGSLSYPRLTFPDDGTRVVGRENIAGHDCIRLETAETTVWFDANTLLVRRVLTQSKNYSNQVVDTYYDLRRPAANDAIKQSPIANESFEETVMQWVPFIPFEQMLENLRITGRAAGLLITPREDQPSGQPALPPLSDEQRAGIVTIEGDELSGLGFYARHQNNDYLITDARFITRNRWLKIRDWQDRKLECIEALQAENSNVVMIKMTRAPGRLRQPTAHGKGLKTYLLCAFNTRDAAMRPAFCVNRPHPSGRYEVALNAADQISGGPIIDTDGGAAVGILIESDLGQPKRAGVLTGGWHAEPLFSHKRWYPIGLVPQR